MATQTAVALAMASAMLWLGLGCSATGREQPHRRSSEGVIALPPASSLGNISVEETLARRRSIREYADAPLVAAEVGQLLWAAQGTSGARGYRTAPSAGALYPLELYLVAGRVEGLEAGVYHYDPAGHALTSVTMGDRRADLAAAALGQASVRDAAVNLVFVAEFERTTQRYGERGVRYVYMEAGHAAQNVLLQCVSLELGAVVIGAFEESTVSDLLLLSETETPLYIIPVGRPR